MRFRIELPLTDYVAANQARHLVARILDDRRNAYERTSDPRIYEKGVRLVETAAWPPEFRPEIFVIEVSAVNHQDEGDNYDIKRRLTEGLQRIGLTPTVHYGKSSG